MSTGPSVGRQPDRSLGVLAVGILHPGVPAAAQRACKRLVLAERFRYFGQRGR